MSRLELEAGGKSFVEEKDTITTILVSRAKFLKGHRQLAKRLAQAHAELTAWIDAHPAEAQKLVCDQLVAEMKHDISADLFSHAWRRLRFTLADYFVTGFPPALDNSRKVIPYKGCRISASAFGPRCNVKSSVVRRATEADPESAWLAIKFKSLS